MSIQIPWIYILQNKDLLGIRDNEYLQRNIDDIIDSKNRKQKEQNEKEMEKKAAIKKRQELEANIKREVQAEMGLSEAQCAQPIFPMLDEYATAQEEKKQNASPA